jgi:hypothetical protein
MKWSAVRRVRAVATLLALCAVGLDSWVESTYPGGHPVVSFMQLSVLVTFGLCLLIAFVEGPVDRLATLILGVNGILMLHSLVRRSVTGWFAGVVNVASIALLVGALLSLWFIPFRARRRRTRWFLENRCEVCGYDLRATPRQCPECGARYRATYYSARGDRE